MHCRQLSVIQFRNLEEIRVELSSKFNCFAGHNGAGKTNLLDAIYYLSFCKSFTNPVDIQNIQFGKDFFVIQGHYQINGAEDTLHCGVKRGQRKVFQKNKKEYERLSDHIGQYPLVVLSPSDSRLISGGSEERRKFIDGVISQYNKEYLHQLIAYNKSLQQRNALLKRFAEKGFFNKELLATWDEQLIDKGTYIYEERSRFFESFLPVFREYYALLSGEKENTGIDYETTLRGSDFRILLEEALEKDRTLQYSTMGIHKDELLFLIHNEPIKKYGSQGQQKSFIIALKLAQFAFTKKIKGANPILLFDDIFDKLDNQRVEHLMQLVSKEDFGQVFITDTHPGRLEELFVSIGSECLIYTMENGTVTGSKVLNTTSA